MASTTQTTTSAVTSTTAAAGTSDSAIATTAFVYQNRPGPIYRTVTQAAGYVTAGQMATTYVLPAGGQQCATVGTGSIYPIALFYNSSTLYPTVNGIAPVFGMRATCCTNDAWSATTSVVVGLYPVTRPASTGGAGINKYTFGTVVTGTSCTFTDMTADSLNSLFTAGVEIPVGLYALGVVLGGTISLPASSHAHITCDVVTHYYEVVPR